PSQIQVLTWNVNFSNPLRRQRLDRILFHITNDIFEGRAPPPACVILFQEVHQQALPLLLAHPFVRAHFAISTISHDTWPNPSVYGNVTLVSTGIPIRAAFSIKYPSTVMGRHAIFVDVQLAAYHTENNDPFAKSPRQGASADLDLIMKHVVVRIANTQLESFVGYGERARLHQLVVVARFLRSPSLHGGIVGGDMNTLTLKDDGIHTQAGLRDPHVGSPTENVTWGMQPSTDIPPKRLDRFYVTRGRGVSLDPPRIVGAGLTMPSDSDRVYASDHCGVSTIVRI
ncbi:hypothetical protein SISNIDRAFT_398936, partial [Sistotremastrum niveocremeum HHB9708]